MNTIFVVYKCWCVLLVGYITGCGLVKCRSSVIVELFTYDMLVLFCFVRDSLKFIY